LVSAEDTGSYPLIRHIQVSVAEWLARLTAV